MKKQELKALIKPLIKECLKEVLIEEGFAKMLSESVISNTTTQVVNTTPPIQKNNLVENRKKMLDAIGMGSFDPFNGTKPLKDVGESYPQVAVTGLAPEDSGVDISKLLENKQIWKQQLNAMTGKKDKE